MNQNLTVGTSSPLHQTVQRLVRKIRLLHQAALIRDSVSQKILEQSQQALFRLKELSHEPVGAIGYVTACCMTKTNLNHIFDYQYCDEKHPDAALLKEFYQPRNLFRLFHRQNVLQAADLTSFLSDFPNLTRQPFVPDLYDVLNNRENEQPSFSEQLGQALQKQYEKGCSADRVDQLVQQRLLTLIDDLARKGYPSVQLLAARIAGENQNQSLKTELLNAVLCNKYSSKAQQKTAADTLRFNQTRTETRLNRSYTQKLSRTH